MSYLIHGSKWHDEDGDEEVGNGQAQDEVVGHVLKVPLQNNRRNHKHIAWKKRSLRSVQNVFKYSTYYLFCLFRLFQILEVSIKNRYEGLPRKRDLQLLWKYEIWKNEIPNDTLPTIVTRVMSPRITEVATIPGKEPGCRAAFNIVALSCIPEDETLELGLL